MNPNPNPNINGGRKDRKSVNKIMILTPSTDFISLKQRSEKGPSTEAFPEREPLTEKRQVLENWHMQELEPTFLEYVIDKLHINCKCACLLEC